jgi:hypothetical protein
LLVRPCTIATALQVKSSINGAELYSNQGLKLAYDNSVLQLLRWNGTEIPDSAFESGQFLTVSGLAVANTPLFSGTNRCLITKDNSGDTRYFSFEPSFMDECFECSKDYTTLEQIRFAFRPGKTIADLNENTIRLMRKSVFGKS